MGKPELEKQLFGRKVVFGDYKKSFSAFQKDCETKTEEQLNAELATLDPNPHESKYVAILASLTYANLARRAPFMPEQGKFERTVRQMPMSQVEELYARSTELAQFNVILGQSDVAVEPVKSFPE